MLLYEALSQSDGEVGVHSNNCIGCEMCNNVRPFDSINLLDTTANEVATGGFVSVPDAAFEHDKFKTRHNNPALFKEEAEMEKEPALGE